MWNDGRAGQSKTSAFAGYSFVDGTGILYSNLSANTNTEPILVWNTIIAVYRNSKTIAEAHEVLAMLGIDHKDLDELKEQAQQSYASLRLQGSQ